MRSTMRFEMVRPRPVPPNLRVELPSACSNSRKMRAWSSARNADAGVAHRDRDRVRLRVRLDDDRDAAKLGELDGVAGEIEQHLAQPRRIADHARRQALVDIAADFEALGLGARPEQFDGLFDEGGERKWPRLEIEPAGFDLGEIEHFLDERQQRVARRLHRVEVGGLFRRQRRIAEQVGHAEDAVERRADLVRDHRQEPRLGAARRFRLIARVGERALRHRRGRSCRGRRSALRCRRRRAPRPRARRSSARRPARRSSGRARACRRRDCAMSPWISTGSAKVVASNSSRGRPASAQNASLA